MALPIPIGCDALAMLIGLAALASIIPIRFAILALQIPIGFDVIEELIPFPTGMGRALASKLIGTCTERASNQIGISTAMA